METLRRFRKVLPDELRRQLTEEPKPLLIDTLPPEHFRTVHLPEAQNACVYEVTFLSRMAALTAEKSALIVLYGGGGRTREAEAAAEKLERAGYRNLALLDGGLAGWLTAGLPLDGPGGPGPEDLGEAGRIAEGVYRVDVAQSGIEWTGRNPNGRHHGTVRLAAGTMTVTAAGVAGDFTIDMRSIANTDLTGDASQPVLLAHLNSDDFFFTELFPTARFVLRGARRVAEPSPGAPNFTVEGTLDLRGVRADLSFPATVTPAAEGRLIAEAHFDIDRTRWQVLYGSGRFFDHLGKHLVFDPISLQVRVVAG